MSTLKDLTGMKFGRLTVIGRVANNAEGRAMWECQCECGLKKIVKGKNLINGATKSCGCMLKEHVGNLNHSHGMSNTKLYKKWQVMNTRCNNKNRDHAQWYMEKGIEVCEEWRDFLNFYDWAMTNGYEDGLSIERIDINKGYEPKNCKWIQLKEQAFNKSNTHWITFQGKTQSLTKWAEEIGISVTILKDRINRYKWDVERALTTPPRPAIKRKR